jgi:hypothetical protein
MRIFYLIIIAILLFIVYTYIFPKHHIVFESFENIHENIGNYLSNYYYKLFISILQQQDFVFESPSNAIFLNKLPQNIPFIQNIQIYDALTKNNITYDGYKSYESVSFWEFRNKSSDVIHTTMKPVMHTIIKNALTDSGLHDGMNTNTVIHFRCADTPFEKNFHYHFQRYQYFKDALEKIENENKTIVLLYNNTHLSDEKQKNTCNIYVKKLTEYLESHGYIIDVQSKTNVEDFATMFFAPAVISTSSSFSFMSGFFGNGQYIQPTFFNGDYVEQCTDCSDFILKGYNISHKNVDDYHDIDTVYKLLITTQ